MLGNSGVSLLVLLDLSHGFFSFGLGIKHHGLVVGLLVLGELFDEGSFFLVVLLAFGLELLLAPLVALLTPQQLPVKFLVLLGEVFLSDCHLLYQALLLLYLSL